MEQTLMRDFKLSCFMTGIFILSTNLLLDFFIVSFIVLITLKSVVQSSKFMLNQSGESRHPCFVTNLRGNAFKFFTNECNVSCRFVI